MDCIKRWGHKLKSSSSNNTANRPLNPAYNSPPAPHPHPHPHPNPVSYDTSPDSKPPGPSSYPASTPPLPPYSTYNDTYKPPSFPPPTDADDLPPPPTIKHDFSPAFNSSQELYDSGIRYCHLNPLFPAQRFAAGVLDTVSSIPGPLALSPPPRRFSGKITDVNGGVLIEANGCEDTCLMSSLPLFAAGYHHPANTRRGRVFGYEVMILALPAEAAVLAVGLAGAPYPGFRLPGWHRASVGVHSDDGRRYCNDSYGGQDFTSPFRAGERVGIGMRFPVEGGKGIEVFFTRNGKPVGGWRLYEAVDSEERRNPAEGLDGGRDIYAAIGVFGTGLRVVVDNFYSTEE